MTENNNVIITGEVEEPSIFTKEYENTKFYKTEVRVKRTSGVYDIIPVVTREPIEETGEYTIKGRFRSRNTFINEKRKLILEVYAEEVNKVEQVPHDNKINLTGFIVKTPQYRITPLKKEICDVMIAVNSSNNSYYIPLILWGKWAKEVSKLKVGDKITVRGRIQSREYTKVENDITEVRVAYEVSAFDFYKEDEEKNEELQGWVVTLFNYNKTEV